MKMLSGSGGAYPGEHNELIKMPDRLYTDDGRELLITRWSPTVSMDEPDSVIVEAILALPENA